MRKPISTPHGAIIGKTQSKLTNFYNLDAISFVAYCVNSKKATHFRIWATKVLKEFTLKGFVLDDERLKQGGAIFKSDFDQSMKALEKRINK